ncbi:MAG: hypothetical protein K6E92_10610 [Lachnospiraceae bacterium]|nr:hypothetical protein [Lachnospiraceae bacterium]
MRLRWKQSEDPEEGFFEEGDPEEGYPEEIYPEDGDPEGWYPEEEYPEEGYAEEEYPEEGYPEEEYPEEGYPEEAYAEEADPEYDEGSAGYEESGEYEESAGYDESGEYDESAGYDESGEYDEEPAEYDEFAGYDEESAGYDESAEYEEPAGYPEYADDDAYDGIDETPEEEEPEGDDRSGSPRMIRIMIVLAAVIFLLIAAAGGLLLHKKGILFPAGGRTENVTAETAKVQIPELKLPEGDAPMGVEVLQAALEVRLRSIAQAAAEAQQEPQIVFAEEELENTVRVQMDLTSVQKDLKIKFLNADTRRLIANVPFTLTVTMPNGEKISWSDDDRDGIIYHKKLTAGTYRIHVEPLGDVRYEGYAIPDDRTADVKDEIEYKKVDVEGEVLSAAEVNEAAEDTAHNLEEEEAVSTDTVAWAESTVTYSYEELTRLQVDATMGTVSGNDVNLPENRLHDEQDKPLFVKTGETYREATVKDFLEGEISVFYRVSSVFYTGWQTIDGATYYYTPEGQYVTGEQIIRGARYLFADDGKLRKDTGVVGIDVSKWNGTIDWTKVAASGIGFAVIRVGYRGSSQGALIDDAMFEKNIKGAKAAGLKVGVYFYSQAVDEVEALYEASMVLDRISGYSMDLPVFIDIEPSGGRGDKISAAERTAVIKTFCETVRSAGYTAGVYSNKNWLAEKMDTSAFSAYRIWLAQYAVTPTYGGRYEYWQYSRKGTVDGIEGEVDMDLAY